MISKLVFNLFSCPTHPHQIIAPKKIVDNEKSKKKLPSCMYGDFHAHLVETNLKTQASNMHEKPKDKVKKEFPYIFTEERYMTSKFTKFTSMRSVKDMDSTTCWKWLCCFAHVRKEVANTSKDYIKMKKVQRDSKVSFYAPIYQHFWIGILKLTSGCPAYHRCH